ncbi:MAG: NosD domain-containing protein [Nanoarchaeota archaeon]
MGKGKVFQGNIKLYFVTFIFLILLITPVFAADVVYIYRKSFRIDNNIMKAFENLGLSVEKIQEEHLLSDFSKYKLIFLGDENFKNIKKISEIISQNPSIIVNSYHGKELGLTDSDGISQLGSTDPLSVVKNGGSVQVYTSARSHKGTSVNYFYLDTLNKAPSLLSIAFTETTSSGYKFGDVIACASAGSLLANGKITKRNICFFGIAESDFWTPSAQNLFEDSVRLVAITCTLDSQCPAPTTSPLFCLQNTISFNKTSYFCENPGEVTSKCVPVIEKIAQEQCKFGCQNAQCLKGKHDVSLVDFSDSINKIKIENQNGELVNNNRLKCNEKYKISVKVKNSGDFYENVSFSSKIDSLSFDHLPIENLVQGDESLKTKTVNITLIEGFYNISIRAMIDKDENPVNNLVQREVFVSCPVRFIACSSNSQCDDQNPLTLDECINAGTTASQCRNTEINCANDLDCGSTGFIGTEYCSEKNVVKNYQTSKCFNAGTTESYCSISALPKTINTCSAVCSAGTCVQCNNDADCDDSDADTRDICNNPGTASSYCSSTRITEQIVCNKNSDCGTDGFIDSPYCSTNFVVQKFKTFTCNNSGTTQSSCSSSITEKNKEQCANDCSSGQCTEKPQGKHDISLIEFSNSVNKIRIENSDGEIISSNELNCNEKYKIIIKVKNSGDFYENITFSCNIGDLPFAHLPIENLAPASSTEKTKTVNITLPEGYYNLTVAAIISEDSNSIDNFAKREIKVNCEQKPATTGPFCIDNDGGADFYKYSNVSVWSNISQESGSIGNSTGTPVITFGYAHVFDRCLNSEYLLEYVCDAPGSNKSVPPINYKCPYGCYKGACRNAEIKNQEVSDCTTINIPNSVYTLKNDIFNRIYNCFIIKADNVTLDGAEHFIDGDNRYLNYAIIVESVKNATVKDLLIKEFSYGIFLNNSFYSAIENLSIMKAWEGIHLSSSSGNKIINNNLNNNTFGSIVIYNNSNNNLILRNNIEKDIDGYGILIEESKDNNLTENILKDNLAGIYLLKSSGNTVNKNTAKGNGNGIGGVITSKNSITDNLIRENEYGSIFYSISDSIIKRNTYFQNIKYQLSIDGDSEDNDVSGNFFL